MCCYQIYNYLVCLNANVIPKEVKMTVGNAGKRAKDNIIKTATKSHDGIP